MSRWIPSFGKWSGMPPKDDIRWALEWAQYGALARARALDSGPDVTKSCLEQQAQLIDTDEDYQTIGTILGRLLEDVELSMYRDKKKKKKTSRKPSGRRKSKAP